jgi:undecaprenyl-diphosphatase
MTAFQALVLGIVQGLSEFLPISSSGHLLLTRYLLGWDEPGVAFDVALHIGTLVAVIWYFRREWLDLVTAVGRVIRQRGPRTPVERRALFIAVATIPAGIAGYFLADVDDTALRDPTVTAVTLIVFGLLLWLVDRYAARTRTLESMGWVDAIAIGIAQTLALVPGVSRSGATMTAGRGLGFDRPAAAVFSFLLSMPIIAAAALRKAPEALAAAGNGGPLLVGIIAAAISGWLAIAVLLRLVTTRGYGPFAVYRIAVALLVLWTVAARA